MIVDSFDFLDCCMQCRQIVYHTSISVLQNSYRLRNTPVRQTHVARQTNINNITISITSLAIEERRVYA